MMKKSSFALVVPCYNEEKVIPIFKKEISNFIAEFESRFNEIKLSLILVDNNSLDNSKKLLKELLNSICSNSQISVQIVSCQKRGYGAALKAGFRSVVADWYGFVDLDNTYPLVSFFEMLSLAQAKNLKIVYANRLFYKTEMPFLRHIGNLIYSYLARALFNNSIQDMCSGMRVFNKSCLPYILAISVDSLRFSIELTAISLKLKWTKAEIPIRYRSRVGNSKLSIIKDGLLFLLSLLKIRLIYNKKCLI